MIDPQNAPQQIAISMEKAQTVYSNMCRGAMTSEEVLLDFALNPNINGRVLDEPAEITTRLVLSFPSAKRLLHLLHAMVTKHEETFGPVPMDPSERARLKQPVVSSE
jgi:lactate dehydrogenase-like 2-hydroxyacid dehydrogenase